MSDQENEAKPENAGGGSKKLLIVGLIAGLVVGGGGAAGALMMLGGGESDPAPVEVVEEKPKKDPHFVKVEKVTLPFILKNRVVATAQLDFSLEVEGNDNKMLMIRNLPEIRDALLRHYSVTPIGQSKNPRQIDYPKLKKTLKDISNKVMHEKMVNRVMVVQARQF